MVSMLGMVLGVASLIVVLAVMNGFAGELRGRILSLVAHGYVEVAAVALRTGASWLNGAASECGGGIALHTGQGDPRQRRTLRGAVLTAIEPELEARVSLTGGCYARAASTAWRGRVQCGVGGCPGPHTGGDSRGSEWR